MNENENYDLEIKRNHMISVKFMGDNGFSSVCGITGSIIWVVVFKKPLTFNRSNMDDKEKKKKSTEGDLDDFNLLQFNLENEFLGVLERSDVYYFIDDCNRVWSYVIESLSRPNIIIDKNILPEICVFKKVNQEIFLVGTDGSLWCIDLSDTLHKISDFDAVLNVFESSIFSYINSCFCVLCKNGRFLMVHYRVNSDTDFEPPRITIDITSKNEIFSMSSIILHSDSLFILNNGDAINLNEHCTKKIGENITFLDNSWALNDYGQLIFAKQKGIFSRVRSKRTMITINKVYGFPDFENTTVQMINSNSRDNVVILTTENVLGFLSVERTKVYCNKNYILPIPKKSYQKSANK